MSNITGGQDLEYAFKLASTLKWRTWPEEKPEEDRSIAIKRLVGSIASGYRFQDLYYLSARLDSIVFQDGDKWMYLSDLEVVR